MPPSWHIRCHILQVEGEVWRHAGFGNQAVERLYNEERLALRTSSLAQENPQPQGIVQFPKKQSTRYPITWEMLVKVFKRIMSVVFLV